MYKRIISVVIITILILSLSSCGKSKKEEDLNNTTLQTSSVQQTSLKEAISSTTETTTKAYVVQDKNDTVQKLNYKINIPKYEVKKEVKSEKYVSDVYYAYKSDVIFGITTYSSGEKYPDGSIAFNYVEQDSVNSINKYAVTDTITKAFKLKENIDVDESLYSKNKEVKTKNNVYKMTGYCYTDQFAKNKESEQQNLIYYYSNAIKVKEKVLILWVSDLTQDHEYQEESAHILNDILMKNV